MTYSNFVKEWQKRLFHNQHERKGQALMNTLRTYDESAYDILTVELRDKDCFYKDDFVPVTLEWLWERWNA
jgi:hypothetical protein